MMDRRSMLIFACTMSLLAVFRADAQQDFGGAHIAIENPAELSMEAAEEIYAELKERLAMGYELSQVSLIDGYQSWARYNSAPYVSATHGRRFVNNYANQKGSSYATLEPGESLPQGTILAKDSMTVTEDGRTFPGAMFIMEKLAAGASPETADWRYIAINPDGSLAGDTVGEGPELVTYCHDCHAAKARRDYTFYVPKKFRTGN